MNPSQINPQSASTPHQAGLHEGALQAMKFLNSQGLLNGVTVAHSAAIKQLLNRVPEPALNTKPLTAYKVTSASADSSTQAEQLEPAYQEPLAPPTSPVEGQQVSEQPISEASDEAGSIWETVPGDELEDEDIGSVMMAITGLLAGDNLRSNSASADMLAPITARNIIREGDIDMLEDLNAQVQDGDRGLAYKTLVHFRESLKDRGQILQFINGIANNILQKGGKALLTRIQNHPSYKVYAPYVGR